MEDLSRPSGMAIPLFLKRKWEKQQLEQEDEDSAEAPEDGEDESQQTNEESTSNNLTSVGENDGGKPSTTVWVPQLRVSLDQELTRDQKHELSNRVFTASELEERILKTTDAMFDIQRQLHRGEEIYFEDTYGHGSIYKGWDGFIDSTSIPGTGGAQMSSNRRVPADSRWFSTSCESVSRTKPPAAFPPPVLSQPVQSAAKLGSISEQQQESGTSINEASQAPANPSSTATVTPSKTASSTETSQPSSARIRQRMAASAAAAEKSETSGNSSASKSSSRPTTPIDDSGNMKKKRKLASATSSEELATKKASQKSSGDDAKRLKTDREPSSTTKAGTKSVKAEKKDAASTPSTKSNKSETSTPGKRVKEDAETPAPRKRGRPRRKSL